MCLCCNAQDDTSRLETVIPIVRAAAFDGDAAALAERVKAVMLAYPRTNAIIMPGHLPCTHTYSLHLTVCKILCSLTSKGFKPTR